MSWNYKTNKMDSYCYYSTMRQHVQTLKRCKLFFSAVRIKNLACNSICDLVCSLLKGMGSFFLKGKEAYVRQVQSSIYPLLALVYMVVLFMFSILQVPLYLLWHW
ncbi:hypothetical protein PVAP13_4NG085041 [Panicum virgatum]|uniref:Uncharacterized protein n=1 Tax=Panicum virgatum TaxID=38727 RepID=A0A8T0T377_PANVG|nr:hypothetical protein PVAP13_4NG085041 [Panicum virgatum]